MLSPGELCEGAEEDGELRPKLWTYMDPDEFPEQHRHLLYVFQCPVAAGNVSWCASGAEDLGALKQRVEMGNGSCLGSRLNDETWGREKQGAGWLLSFCAGLGTGVLDKQMWAGRLSAEVSSDTFQAYVPGPSFLCPAGACTQA